MFVYTVKLDTNLSHHHALEKRFRMADDIYQKTLREILKRTRNMKKDPRYKGTKRHFKRIRCGI